MVWSKFGERARGVALGLPTRRSGSTAAGTVPVPASTDDVGCFAPTMQLYFRPDGSVGPCSWSVQPYGNVRQERLTEIWSGVARRDRRAHLAVGNFSSGCEGCGSRLRVEGRSGSHPEYFDGLRRRLRQEMPSVDPASMPRRLEFDLSNACNLQCVHCGGEFSSAIREHREHRPPLPKVYDDQFFEDLELFLPGALEVSFSGGEPFLAEENTRVWRSMERIARHVPIVISTNATVWDEQVSWVLRTFSVDVIVSLDSLDADVLGSVRVGADLELVLANLDRFAAELPPGKLRINACLMPQTARGMPELVRFAESRQIPLNIRPVFHPSSCAVAALPADELADLVRHLDATGTGLVDLPLNGPGWRITMDRLRAWSEVAASGTDVFSEISPTVLLFAKDGAGPCDDLQARLELAERSGGSVSGAITIDGNDRILAIDTEVAELCGLDAAGVIGQHPSILLDTFDRYDQGPIGSDRVDFTCSIGGMDVFGAMVALRDSSGRCEVAQILFAPVRAELS